LNDDFPDLGGDDGLDADVAEMLRRDSGGNGF
jgi:regulator of Ty1 transposition protein 103